MDSRVHLRTLGLFYKMFLRQKTGAQQIPYIPSKLRVPRKASRLIECVPPEEVGLSSSRIEEFLFEVESYPTFMPHTLSAMRDGKVFFAAAAPGYDLYTRHLTHSLCKSVIGIAAGIAHDEGLFDMDTPLYTYFKGLAVSKKHREITPRHLLTMSTGIAFSETGCVTEEDWVRAFFHSSIAFKPGTAFSYNSMNTYMISALIETVSGEGLVSYLTPRLFSPLGIDDVLWETCPKGHVKGGWGLYLAVPDLLAIGQLLLDYGSYGGRRIVSREWVEEMTRRQKAAPERTGKFDYGYQTWVARDERSFLCNGMMGQNIWVCRETRTVLVGNSGDCDLYQRGPFYDLLNLFFGTKSLPRRQDRHALLSLRAHEEVFCRDHAFIKLHPPKEQSLLRRLFGKTEKKPSLPLALEKLLGQTFLFERNNAGLIPLFVSVMQNNFGEGLRSFSLDRAGSDFYLSLYEGETLYRIPIGFDGYREHVLSMRGEEYLIRTAAEALPAVSPREVALKIEMLFPELPMARRLTFRFSGGEGVLKVGEVPGTELVGRFVENTMTTKPNSGALFDFIEPYLKGESMTAKIASRYEPTLAFKVGVAPPTVLSEDERSREDSLLVLSLLDSGSGTPGG